MCANDGHEKLLQEISYHFGKVLHIAVNAKATAIDEGICLLADIFYLRKLAMNHNWRTKSKPWAERYCFGDPVMKCVIIYSVTKTTAVLRCAHSISNISGEGRARRVVNLIPASYCPLAIVPKFSPPLPSALLLFATNPPFVANVAWSQQKRWRLFYSCEVAMVFRLQSG